MEKSLLFAHTRNNKNEWHNLNDHLVSVAEKTKEFASDFYNGQFNNLAYLIGLIHDIGKSHPQFQEYLRVIDQGKSHFKFPHSPWGATLCIKYYPVFKEFMGLIIGGHHAGLGEISSLLSKLVEKEYDKQMDMLKMMYGLLIDMLKKNYPDIGNLKKPKTTKLQNELLVRMIYSALIDADRLDTEQHFTCEKSIIRKNIKNIEELALKLRNNQNQLLESKKYDSSLVSTIRREVYEACVKKSKDSPGFFRLTVPTGGGKTRSGLSFALEHAVENKLQRVIFALPYTSIIDQTAMVFRDIFGEGVFLEHHSQVIIDENEDIVNKKNLLTLAEENWDMPLIVTTTVQLFESLFSNNPSKCRKIHRLARSVIILDEIQALPMELLIPTFQVLKDLVDNYGSSVVFCTATQPALEGGKFTEFVGRKIEEIVPNYIEHFKKLKRVDYLQPQKVFTMDELKKEIENEKQVLIIFNTKEKAIELINSFNKGECLHLSTLLCGAHRRKVLQKVRNSLTKNCGNVVRLISTQVVEAGVDLDFPVVYREIGPLERIVQAAGRCNREWRDPEVKGKVVIFELEDSKQPRGSYAVGTEQAKVILKKYDDPDILSIPQIYDEYFKRIYNELGRNLDKENIQELREKLNYPETALRYKLINSNTVPVIVKYGEYEKALNEWRNNPKRETWRKLQPFIINIYKHEARKLYYDGLVKEIVEGLFIWEGLYDEIKGIGDFTFDPCDFIV
jgi:CRISPR-associated endonuclease/helicase Cas3